MLLYRPAQTPHRYQALPSEHKLLIRTGDIKTLKGIAEPVQLYNLVVPSSANDVDVQHCGAFLVG